VKNHRAEIEEFGEVVRRMRSAAGSQDAARGKEMPKEGVLVQRGPRSMSTAAVLARNNQNIAKVVALARCRECRGAVKHAGMGLLACAQHQEHGVVNMVGRIWC
jgi:hypothetical protein